MKKLLVVLTVLLSVLFVFAEEVEWMIADVEGGQKGGTLYLSDTSGPKTLNPYWAQESSSTDIMDWYMGSLLGQDDYGFITEPRIASDYWTKKTDNGGMEVFFKLRKGVKWSDGTPLTMEDILFTFEKIAMVSEMTVNGNDFLKDAEGNLPVIEVIDDYTIKFTYENSVLRLAVSNIGSTTILPKHKFEDVADDPEAFAQTWTVEQIDDIVGTGPFVISDYKEGIKVELNRNPYFYAKSKDGVQLPYLDKIVYQIVQNNETEVLKFQSGELDLLSLTAANFVSMKEKEANSSYHTIIGGLVPGPSFVTFNWNSPVEEQRVWFRNLHFRKAVSYALDRQTLVDNQMNGLGVAAFSPQLPGSKYYDKEFINSLGYRYSLAYAKRELQEGGFTWNNEGKLLGPNGNIVSFELTTNVSTTGWVEVGNILTDSLSKLGIDVNFRPIQFNTLVSDLMAGNYQSVIIRLVGDTPDPNDGWNTWQLDGGLHFWNYSPEYLAEANPGLLDEEDYYVPDFEKRIDEIFRVQKVTLDDEKLTELFTEWNNLVAANLPLIYTTAQNILIAVQDDLHLMIDTPRPFVGTLHRSWGVWKEQ